MPATWLTDLPLPPFHIQTDVLKFSLPTRTNIGTTAGQVKVGPHAVHPSRSNRRVASGVCILPHFQGLHVAVGRVGDAAGYED